VPKGSFYHYFSSKEAFTAEIITDYTETLLALMDQHVEGTESSARETIRHLYSMMVSEFERRRGCIRGCLLGQPGGRDWCFQRALPACAATGIPGLA